MTIVSNKDKAIEFSHCDTIHENVVNNGICSVSTYTPTLPTITCSSKKDAELIQQKINAFIRKISYELVNSDKKED